MNVFSGRKFRFLAEKFNFCHTTPILVNSPWYLPSATPIFLQFNDFRKRIFGLELMFSFTFFHICRTSWQDTQNYKSNQTFSNLSLQTSDVNTLWSFDMIENIKCTWQCLVCDRECAPICRELYVMRLHKLHMMLFHNVHVMRAQNELWARSTLCGAALPCSWPFPIRMQRSLPRFPIQPNPPPQHQATCAPQEASCSEGAVAREQFWFCAPPFAIFVGTT